MQENHKKKRLLPRLLVLVLILLLVVGIVLGVLWWRDRPGGLQNYLLLGYDGWGKIDETGRTDTMMLVSLDHTQNRMVLTSFLRDTQVPTPAGGQDKLNTLVQRGGSQTLVNYLEDTYGVGIDGVLSTNFTGMVLLIDSIGGITVELTSAEVSYLKKYAGDYPGYTLQAGPCHLNGAQALEYMRIRALDSDIGRTNRQYLALQAVMEQAKKIGLNQALSLLGNVQQLYITDMSLAAQANLIRDAFRLRNAPMERVQIPAEGTYSYSTLNGASVIRMNQEKNITHLRESLGLPAN